MKLAGQITSICLMSLMMCQGDCHVLLYRSPIDACLCNVINVIFPKEHKFTILSPNRTINVNHVDGYRKPEGASSHNNKRWSPQSHDDGPQTVR